MSGTAIPWARLRDDEGSTLLLTIFYGFLGLVLVLAVVAATSLYLERKQLFTIADGAALAGAESFELDEVTVRDGVLSPELRPEEVRAAAAEYVSGLPQAGLESLSIDRATTDDGVSASVTLSAWWRPPVLTLVVPSGIRLDVTATARSVFR
ncbi:pilus assembly protein TadG-related protein [Luethyella okanaganae]|uniref:Pilus assembly protein TadG-related protein n=1 Tax=Luethyella okanaganae TaxID=69372 RepID=A0ABW1VC72_9MICO